MKGDMIEDPKGLIREAYRIDGITAGECRSIFLDWALGLPDDQDTKTAITALISAYAEAAPDHPMSAVLQEGRQTMARPKRRGGWKSRPRPEASNGADSA